MLDRRQDDSAGASLDARSLTAAYGVLPVVREVSLGLPKGKLTVIAGPNGSGKSTLLAAMARILRPVSGSVLLDGKAIADLPTGQVAKRLGLLPQASIVPEGLTVYDLVSRGRYPHQSLFRQWGEADETAVRRALAATGTEPFADRPVDTLSGGQRQRCFIAMVLAQDTPILLFDEPITYLDPRYQIEVMELIAGLSRDDGRTVVTVLHDLNCAFQYADRIAFMKDGRLHHLAERPEACSADLVGEIFDARFVRVTHPTTGKPAFLPDPLPSEPGDRG